TDSGEANHRTSRGAESWELESEVRSPRAATPKITCCAARAWCERVPHHKPLTIRSFRAILGNASRYTLPPGEEVAGIINGLRYGVFFAQFWATLRDIPCFPGRRDCGHRKRLTIPGSFGAILGNASRYTLPPGEEIACGHQ